MCIFNISRSECNLSLSKRDFFELFCCNTVSYWIREHFVSLSHIWISIKVTFFLAFSFVLTHFLHWKSDKWLLWFAGGVIFYLTTQSRKIPFKKFKVTVKGVMLILQEWNSFCGLVILWIRMASEIFYSAEDCDRVFIRGLVLT